MKMVGKKLLEFLLLKIFSIKKKRKKKYFEPVILLIVFADTDQRCKSVTPIFRSNQTPNLPVLDYSFSGTHCILCIDSNLSCENHNTSFQLDIAQIFDNEQIIGGLL